MMTKDEIKKLEKHLKTVIKSRPKKGSSVFPKANIAVPLFGDYTASPVVATVSINPSGAEFRRNAGKKAKKKNSNLPRRSDLGTEPNAVQFALHEIRHYFERGRQNPENCPTVEYFNRPRFPYEDWFYGLEDVLREVGFSYYAEIGKRRAVHIDVVPWATKIGWSNKKIKSKHAILTAEGKRHFYRTLKLLKTIKVLLVNGDSARSLVKEVMCRQISPPQESLGPYWNCEKWSFKLVGGRQIQVFAWNGFLPDQHMPFKVRTSVRKFVEEYCG